MTQNSLYHRSLRVSAAVVALLLVFESGVVSPVTRQLTHQAGQQVASVIGVGAAVEPNELNTITAALTEQRVALEAREAAVSEREIAVNLSTDGGGNNQTNPLTTYLMSILLFIILVLIILNYVLDFIRERHLRDLALHTKKAS